MMGAKGAIKPVQDVMREAGEKFDPKSYIGAVAGYYTNQQGPDAVVPVQQLDDGLLLQQGRVREGRPRSRTARPRPGPKSWPRRRRSRRRAHRSVRSRPAGRPGCRSRTSRAWHNVPIGTKENGFGGPRRQVRVQQPAARAPHGEPARSGSRRATSPTPGARTRRGGEVLQRRMRDADARRRPRTANINRNAKFKFAVATLPYYADVQGAPQNTIIGGASLWVMAGKKPDEYKGVAKFLTFLAEPEAPGAVAPADRLPADHAGRVRHHQEVGLLRKEPGHRRLGAADDRQAADAELEGPALRQLRRRSAT